MMKYCLLLLIFNACFFQVRSQSRQFSVDPQGKFIYYEVVNLTEVKDSLLSRAKNFLKERKKIITPFLIGDSALQLSKKFIIEKTILVTSHPSGEVSYLLNAEFKNNKYRFWLTNFEFAAYQRDRYGNFVLSAAKSTPLEQMPGKLNAGEWKAIITASYEKVVKFAEEFKKALAEKAIVVPVKKTTGITKDWD